MQPQQQRLFPWQQSKCSLSLPRLSPVPFPLPPSQLCPWISCQLWALPCWANRRKNSYTNSQRVSWVRAHTCGFTSACIILSDIYISCCLCVFVHRPCHKMRSFSFSSTFRKPPCWSSFVDCGAGCPLLPFDLWLPWLCRALQRARSWRDGPAPPLTRISCQMLGDQARTCSQDYGARGRTEEGVWESKLMDSEATFWTFW